jgi:hypothetical protein
MKQQTQIAWWIPGGSVVYSGSPKTRGVDSAYLARIHRRGNHDASLRTMEGEMSTTEAGFIGLLFGFFLGYMAGGMGGRAR